MKELQEKVERLKILKEEQKRLSEEKDSIISQLNELVAYENEDGTWTRFTKVDNLKELEEKGTIFRASSLDRYTTKLEVLKNKPKEIKEIEEEKEKN